MIITIHYQARLSWGSVKPHLCAVEHKIDTETLKTVAFDFEPIELDEPGRVPPADGGESDAG